MFALRNKLNGKLVKFTYEANGDENRDCTSVQFTLSMNGDHVFIKETHADMVWYLSNAATVAWYNADLDTPEIEAGFDLENCEIVELTVN